MSDQGLEGSQPVDLKKHPSGITPTLQNIVSTVNLDCKLDQDCKLDLKAIALQARNAEYNPKVCSGAKSEQQSKLAARKYARIIQKLGFPAKFKDYKIQNIVGTCDVMFPIRLEGLAYSHGAFSSVGRRLRGDKLIHGDCSWPGLHHFLALAALDNSTRSIKFRQWRESLQKRSQRRRSFALWDRRPGLSPWSRSF